MWINTSFSEKKLNHFYLILNEILLIFVIIYSLHLGMILKKTFFYILFQRIESIFRWKTTQLDFQNLQQGSAAVVNITVVVCQRNQNLSKLKELSDRVRTYLNLIIPKNCRKYITLKKNVQFP